MTTSVNSDLRIAVEAFLDGASDSENSLDDADVMPWHHLPYAVLVHIATFLQSSDKRNMALVCQSWYQATRDPSLWRERQFFLYSNRQIPKNIQWLKCHCNHLRHATVMCFGTFEKTREKFFRQLKKTRLHTLELNGTAYWWSTAKKLSTNRKVFRRIIELIKTQTRLKFFQMQQALFVFDTGVAVLDTLADTSGFSITRLSLEDFFCQEYSPHELPKTNQYRRAMAFSACMTKFPNLSDLTINLQFISESLLRWFGETRRHQPVTLKAISWQNSFSTMKRISRGTWKHFASACSPARVCLTLQNIKHINCITNSVLFPTIPLYRLNLLGVTALNERDARQLIGLIKHVETCYSKNIIGFKLWGNNTLCNDIEEALIGLLKRCEWLVDLDLHMDLQPKFMGRVCQLQQNQTIGLHSFRMARSLSHAAEFDDFRRQIQYWYPFFKNLKLNFQIRAESSVIHSAFHSYSFLVADNHGIIDHVDGRDQTAGWHSSRYNVNHSNNNVNNNNNNNSNYNAPRGSLFISIKIISGMISDHQHIPDLSIVTC